MDLLWIQFFCSESSIYFLHYISLDFIGEREFTTIYVNTYYMCIEVYTCMLHSCMHEE